MAVATEKAVPAHLQEERQKDRSVRRQRVGKAGIDTDWRTAH